MTLTQVKSFVTHRPNTLTEVTASNLTPALVNATLQLRHPVHLASFLIQHMSILTIINYWTTEMLI